MVAQGHSPLPRSRSRGRDELSRTLTNLRDTATQRAFDAAQQLRQRGDQYLNDKKHRAAKSASAISAAMRRAAEKLHDSNSGNLGQYVDSAADGIDGIARYIDEQDLNELAARAGQILRRRPALVVGALFITGLSLARFAKATSPRHAAAYGRRRKQHAR